jgi:phage terminase small subunit|tara:strand:+ start:294 stop:794 length:501 start_codon:yes stop_codon:yes gene_type:complete
MSQEVVKKKAHPIDDLTEMQRRFADYLVYNQGRSTFTDAALAAGYSPARARIEGSELMDNPKVIKYLRYKTNEVNRSYTVTKNNYVLRQQRLSKVVEDMGKPEKCLGFENLIGKATAQFVETHLHGNLNSLSKEEKLDQIKRLKEIKEERVKGISSKKLIERYSDK